MSNRLPIESLPAWARLQNVDLDQVSIARVDGKGYGLVANFALDFSSGNNVQTEPILRVPADLMLSSESVEAYAKTDTNFRALLEVVGREIKADKHLKRCAPTPWTEYLRLIPWDIPVPTRWSEEERLLLRGSSLEDAVGAKLLTLGAEFERVREASSAMPFWHSLFWEHSTTSLADWILADAWYRSRSLELPTVGHCMVALLDMANHSSNPSAYYEEGDQGAIDLLVQSRSAISAAEEITISYGKEKSLAEMLFSYGFLDGSSHVRKLSLHLEGAPDDPLAEAKLHIFDDAPTVTLSVSDGGCQWESSFAFLVCLNEEDGLQFRVLQDSTGGLQLKLYWQGEDVTEGTKDFEALVRGQPMQHVFRLRVVAILLERLKAQLVLLESAPHREALQPMIDSGIIRKECVDAAELLKRDEMEIIRASVDTLQAEVSAYASLIWVAPVSSATDLQGLLFPHIQKSNLLTHPSVLNYLGLAEVSQGELAADGATGSTDGEDFS